MAKSSVRRAGTVVIATAALAKVVGLVREAVIAGTYGTSHAVDVYLAGITLPAMAMTIAFHSVPNAFVPLFSEASPHQQARRHAWGILGFALLLSSGMWSLAGPIASLTNSGFPESLRLETAVVLRITAGGIALATLEALLRSRLLAHKRFVRPGLSLLLQSAAMIIAVGLYPDGGARTLAWGYFAGTAAAALCNLTPAEFICKRSPRVSESTTSLSSQDSIGLWVPIVLLIDTVPQFYLLIDRHLGSHLPEGSIAALHYAGLISTAPISICGLALGTAVFPYLSEALGRRDLSRASEILDKSVALCLIMTVPIMIWLVLLGQEITGLLYERGAFDQASRLLTGWTLVAYAQGLVPSALILILPKVFYSSRRWRPVLLASALSVAAKGVLSFWLVDRHGAVGLAAASAIASSVGVLFLLLALPTAFTAGRWRQWAQTALVLSAISGFCTLAAIALARLLPIDSQPSLAIVELACAVLLTGAIVYSVAPQGGLREINVLKNTINRLASRS